MAKGTARLPAVLAALACGCGPVAATSVIDDAQLAIERTHAADGDKYAQYETTLADLYLAKAKEEQGRAQYAAAADLGAQALKFAETATRKAAERRTSGTPPTAPPATIRRPDAPAAQPPAPSPQPPAPEKKP